MKDKREIHLAVNLNQLENLERSLFHEATKILSIKKHNLETKKLADDSYNDIMNLIHQLKKERKRIF